MLPPKPGAVPNTINPNYNKAKEEGTTVNWQFRKQELQQQVDGLRHQLMMAQQALDDHLGRTRVKQGRRDVNGAIILQYLATTPPPNSIGHPIIDIVQAVKRARNLPVLPYQSTNNCLQRLKNKGLITASARGYWVINVAQYKSQEQLQNPLNLPPKETAPKENEPNLDLPSCNQEES